MTHETENNETCFYIEQWRQLETRPKGTEEPHDIGIKQLEA